VITNLWFFFILIYFITCMHPLGVWHYNPWSKLRVIRPVEYKLVEEQKSKMEDTDTKRNLPVRGGKDSNEKTLLPH
jgi:hypothetical protein